MIGITERGDAAIDTSWIDWVTNGNPAILITKDPNLLSYHVTKEMNIIIHCTITGYGGSALEPHVPNPSTAIRGLKNIQSIIGKDRVVLRVDPIITSYPKRPLDTIEELKNEVSRIRISFLDMYPHVKTRLAHEGIDLKQDYFHAPIQERRRLFNKIKNIFPSVEVCGEPDLECTGCISELDLKIFGICSTKGKCQQRKDCHCLAEKKELLSNKKQCPHGCLYCFWK